MGDNSTLLPPSTGILTPATPSGLTPNTRSEAEAALTLNSSAQTDSAAPTTPLPHHTKQLSADMDSATAGSEAQQAYRRPGVLRTSSTNYAEALHKAHQDTSASSKISTDSTEGVSITNGQTVSSPTDATIRAFPEPGQGVVPLHTGVSSGQAEAVKKVRPSGLSLGALGRQQSWSEQDMKHVYTGKLLSEPKGDAGYSSGNEGRAVGP